MNEVYDCDMVTKNMGLMGSMGTMKIINPILPINPIPPKSLANPIEFDGIKTQLTTDHRFPRLPGSK